MASMKAGEETSDETILHMDVEQVPVVPTMLTQANFEDEEPLPKRSRTDDSDVRISMDDSIKTILFNINKAICCRLDSMEHKLNNLHNTCSKMGRKLDGLNVTVVRALSKIKEMEKPPDSPSTPNNTVVIGLPPEDDQKEPPYSRSGPPISRNISRNVTLITLNTEDDYPNGSWLGDESNVECRVRCGISPTDMLHVMQTARTPEKCALKLLDYLFDRETQATSNLSGTGKHGKKQLNPLMIYGLRCHLIKHFDITDMEWHRIRMNIDSKCRTAFRRKQRGLPLTVKAFGYKTGMPERDQMLELSGREDAMSDSHDSHDGSQVQPHSVHMQLPVSDDQLEEVSQDEEQDQQDGGTVIKKVCIERDGIKLHEGQINITQSGEIQLAVVEELADGTTETTLVLQQKEPEDENHQSHLHHQQHGEEQAVRTDEDVTDDTHAAETESAAAN